MPQQPVRIAPSILPADFAALGPRDRGGHGGRRRLDPCRRHGQPLRAQPHHRPDGGEGAASRTAGCRSTVISWCRRSTPLVPAFAEAGADTISFHPEAGPHVHRTIQLIKSLGKRAGCVLNPATPLAAIENVLARPRPGAGDERQSRASAARPSSRASWPRSRPCARRSMRSAKPIDLEVDGGVNAETARRCIKAGADAAGRRAPRCSAAVRTSTAANIKALRA